MDRNTTSNEIVAAKTGNGQNFTQKDFDTNVIKLMLEEPFFAGILRGVNYVRTHSIPTAGVSTRKCEITMFWNPDFMASLTKEQIMGLLKHEAMHLALEHTTDRRMEPHLVHNYATDLAINSDIPEEQLPEGGLIPGVAFKELTESQLSKMDSKSVDRYYRISKKIESFPRNMSSEWYFKEILEDEELKEDIENSSEESGMDSHEGWGGMSEEEKELMKGRIKQAVTDAVKEADRTGRWGSVSGETRATLRKLISNEINWRSVLKKFCGLSRRGTRTTSWTRLNKKYAGMTAGIKRGYTSNIAVYIDQSGSVSQNDLEIAFAELKSLSKKTEFTTFHFDTSVDLDSESVWRSGRTPEAHRTRCGGTDFECVTRHANENAAKYDGYIIITDGEAPKPSSSRLKRGWLLVPNTKLIFENDKRDFVMKMKG